jgi:8-oxo-dGTP pyrophosphatase MutT (NUDIX family)
MPSSVEPVLRPTARVLLVDDRDRFMLFRMVSEDFGDTFWFPPGGALEAGETHEMAAVRELQEETGWAHPVIGPLIGFRRHINTWGGVLYDCRENWFVARVDDLVVDTAGFTEEEREEVLDHHWWTLAEMQSTRDRLVPANLAELAALILVSGPPAEPMQLST